MEGKYRELRVSFVDELSNKMVKNLVPFYESIDDNIANSSELDEFLHKRKISSPQNVQMLHFIAESAGLSDLKRSIIAYQTKYSQIEAHETASQAIEHEYRRLCELFVTVLSNSVVKEITGFYDDIPNRISTSREMMITLRTRKVISSLQVDKLRSIAKTTGIVDLADAVREYTTKFAKKIAAEKEKQELCKETANLEVREGDNNTHIAAGHPNMFNVPRKSLDYIDRDVQEKLEKIMKGLSSTEAETECFAIVGEQGTGKTQVVRNFCHLVHNKFELIRVISGDGKNAFRNDMIYFSIDIGYCYEKIEYTVALQEVKNYLTTKRNWLIVVDNFERFDTREVQESFPSAGGVILFTSIASNVLKKGRRIQMVPFSKREIVEYFNEVLEFPMDEKTILEIGEIFGYNPQAISVCARYMNEECYDSDDPKKDIEDNMHTLIYELKNKDRDISVKKMYERSLNKVKEEGADVWNLLCKISILNPNGVSKKLVRDVLLGPGSTSSLGKCVGTIKRLGLVQGSDDYVMHRLMQKIVQEKMKEEGTFIFIVEEVISNLESLWNNDLYDVDSWEIMNVFGDHFENLWSFVNKSVNIDKKGMLLRMNASYLEFIMRVKYDLERFQVLMKDLDKRFEPEMSRSCKFQVNKVQGLFKMSISDTDGALMHFKECLELHDSPMQWLEIHLWIGVVYEVASRNDEMFAEFTTVLDLFNEITAGKSDDSNQIIRYTIVVARIYLKMENFTLFRKYFLEAFRKALKRSGHGDATDDGIYEDLERGSHLMLSPSQRDWEKGRVFMKKGLAKMKEKYISNEDICRVAKLQNLLGQIFYANGRYAVASGFFEQAYAEFKQIFGENDEETIHASEGINRCVRKRYLNYTT